MLLITIFLLFVSCNKKYHAVGRVYNPITGEGIANAKVKFSRSTTGELPGGFEEVISTLTDANGNYELEYKGRVERVKLEVNENFYELGTLDGGEYLKEIRIEPKKTQEIDWHAVQYGKLQTNVKYRINPNKQIFQPGIHYGCYNYSGPPSSNIPMGYYDFTWTVTKTSTGTNTFTEEVFVPAGGIGEITINY